VQERHLRLRVLDQGQRRRMHESRMHDQIPVG
jgi:hypothetical protein